MSFKVLDPPYLKEVVPLGLLFSRFINPPLLTPPFCKIKPVSVACFGGSVQYTKEFYIQKCDEKIELF